MGPLWVATAMRDKTGGNWCVFCYFLVLLSLVASFLLLALLLLLQAGRARWDGTSAGGKSNKGQDRGQLVRVFFVFLLNFHFTLLLF